jgi:hypothetical protein
VKELRKLPWPERVDALRAILAGPMNDEWFKAYKLVAYYAYGATL